MSKPEEKPAKEFEFFVDGVRYTTDQAALTGAQIKAKVPDWPAGYGLMLDPRGPHEEERLIGDNDVVSLEKDHGPARFTRVPPATFGARA